MAQTLYTVKTQKLHSEKAEYCDFLGFTFGALHCS